MKISTKTGHLTATEKKHIALMFDNNLMHAKVNTKVYSIFKKENELYEVVIQQIDRGLIPVPGSELRESKYKATFSIIGLKVKALNLF